MQTYANVMFTRLWTKCPLMENWCVYIGYCVHTEPPKQTPSCAEFERQNRGYYFRNKWIGSRPLLRQWFFKIVQILIIGVSLSKLVGSLNNNKKDVNCVCDPMKSMNATYCLRLISIGSWRSTENVVSNEKYRCLPYNDKLRKLKFFWGTIFLHHSPSRLENKKIKTQESIVQLLEGQQPKCWVRNITR